VVWIARLSILDNDSGEHWFDNWELRASAIRANGTPSFANHATTKPHTHRLSNSPISFSLT
jgi:hypothetical protein